MYNVLFIFAMQMILVVLIGSDFIADFSLLKCHTQVAITRFVCAYLLHFAMEPEFRQSLAMFKYWCNHSNNLALDEPKAPAEPEYEKEEDQAQEKEEKWDADVAADNADDKEKL